MKASFKDLDKQVKGIDITIEKDDYQKAFDAEMKKLRKEAQIKGFRQGKTPMSVIRKYYGESVLAKAVTSALEEQLAKAISEEKLQNITKPRLSENSKQHTFDSSSLGDYDFSFELPVYEDFELAGIEGETIIDYEIEVDPAIVEDEFTTARKRMGSNEDVEKDIFGEDLITIHCQELDENGAVKEGGWETGFSVLVNLLTEHYNKEVLGKDLGHTFDFNIYELEQDKTDKYVKKYLLNLDDEEEKEIGDMFRGEVKTISRIVPAEVNQDFLDKYMGEGVVSSEEEAKEKISENISNYYKKQTEAFRRRTILEHLMEHNTVNLPDDFLKKYLLETNEELTQEIIDKEYDAYAENVKWDAIKDRLYRKYETKVEIEEVKANLRSQIVQYLGAQAQHMDLEPIVNNLMGEQKEVAKAYEEVASQKMLNSVAEDMTLQVEKISVEKFGEMVKEMNEKLKNQ